MNQSTTPSLSTRVAQRLQEFTWVQTLLLAVSAVMIALAVVFTLQADTSEASTNTALLDEGHDKAVAEVVARGLTQVLSYDYQNAEATAALANQVLDGQARKEYDLLFTSLQERAPDQKLVMSTAVQAWAMQDLTETRAKLLVFLDQTSTRVGDKESSVYAAQLDITAEKRGKTWVITGLQPL